MADGEFYKPTVVNGGEADVLGKHSDGIVSVAYP
jgi:hypothetical protein